MQTSGQCNIHTGDVSLSPYQVGDCMFRANIFTAVVISLSLGLYGSMLSNALV